MINTEMSSNTKAILLLTAPLLLGRGKRAASVKLLSVSEYGRLVRLLHKFDRQPADLLGPGAGAILQESLPSFDNERISQLLERGFLLSQAIDHWQTRAIWVVSRADPEYPKRFKERLGKFAPPVLYGCGAATLLENGGLAVVGSRDASDEVLEYAHSVGRLAAEAQCPIISGGARGVDKSAMRGALSEGGMAVGVLSGGLEKDVMNRGNRDLLINERLVLVSPYDPKAGFNVGNAMQRNKLVYALADAGLVVETDTKGGTWTGALEQLDKAQFVPVYVRSGGGVGDGLRTLLRKGAHKWPNPSTSEELISVLSGEVPHTQIEDVSQPAFFAMEPDDANLTDDSALHKRDDSSSCEPTETIASAPDALFAKAVELLRLIDFPTNESEVAAHLGIAPQQARAWLKRLVDEGEWVKKTKPARYERKQSADRSITTNRLL